MSDLANLAWLDGLMSVTYQAIFTTQFCQQKSPWSLYDLGHYFSCWKFVWKDGKMPHILQDVFQVLSCEPSAININVFIDSYISRNPHITSQTMGRTSEASWNGRKDKKKTSRYVNLMFRILTTEKGIQLIGKI